MTVAWVIGARGLLGSAIIRAIDRRPGWSLLEAEPLPWADGTDAVRAAASALASRLVEKADGDRWAVIWAGGAAVTSSSDRQVDEELAQLRAALEGAGVPLGAVAASGTLFYASSAGGVYAGSSNPPFTESSEPHPVSPYGRFKLQGEEAVRQFANSIGAASVIGRIANLYGPGQRLDKLQGLISHIALARLTSNPVSIFVPLDTLRDYIYVDDCADLILRTLDRSAIEGGSVTKILASGQATTIAALLGHFRALSKGRPRVVLGSSDSGAFQAHDLRLRGEVWTELDAYQAASLPEGIHATMTAIEEAVREGRA